ncbi:phage Gp37/Gp68 family protein [Boseaceae bacterium BT-24-1]|nr:phage Gp37/Gp68 family protein [Boseaceae bacterium BT-24-1]
MAETTHISWCDHTFNPWIGCQKVSPACDGCYAEQMMASRHKRVVWGKPGQKPTYSRTGQAYWREPLKWNRKAAEAGTRPFVFCASLADVFDNNVDPEWRADLFDLIDKTPHLVWLLLTKRPQNIVEMVHAAGGMPPHARNVAFGTTIEDQKRANLNGPHLLKAGAALDPLFLFYSCEPLLEIITPPMAMIGQHIGWVITGGETDQGDHRARPTHPDAFRRLRDQAADFGAAFHHKQNGEWSSIEPEWTHWMTDSGAFGEWSKDVAPGRITAKLKRVGKRRPGRLLDRVEHNARPEVPAL